MICPKKFKCPYISVSFGFNICEITGKVCHVHIRCGSVVSKWLHSADNDNLRFRQSEALASNLSLKNGFFGMNEYFDKRQSPSEILIRIFNDHSCNHVY